MLTITFEIAGQCHALSCAPIVEIVPLVALHRVAAGPAWLRGMLIYRGQAIPVVDLSQWLGGRPCAELLSSRVAIVRGPYVAMERLLLGLLAEKMTEVRELEIPAAGGVRTFASTALGPTLMEGGALLQIIDERVLFERLNLAQTAQWLPPGNPAHEADRDSSQP